MSKVPAWKRLGLQVKEETESSPLTTATHLEGDAISKKLAKKLNKKRQLAANDDQKTKKPPKRVKVPKLERAPPPEKDQLAYLRQFARDRANWKFSKQKQNWLLKNIETIPEDYESDLVTYVEGIQGGARDRLVDDLKLVVEKWNGYARKLEEKINAELYGEKAEKADGEKEKKDGESKKDEIKPECTKEYATRSKKILILLTGESMDLYGEESEESEEETANKAEEEKNGKKPQGENDEASSSELVIDEVEVETYGASSDEESE